MYISEQKKVNEQFGRKMNRNRREVSNATGENVESCSRIKDGDGRPVQGEDEMLKI